MIGKMRHCFNCGEELGIYADYDRLDTCGKVKCERAAAAILEEDREEAHRRLDDDMDWRRW